MISTVTETQVSRRWSEDGAYKCYLNFVDSDKFLDSLDIPRDAKILSMYAYPQNGSFLQMKRKGYTVMWHMESVVQSALTWDFDYIVIEDRMYCENYEEHKDVLSRFSKVAGNGRISVCTLSDSVVCTSTEDFLNSSR
jgi:hypothetical protein